MCKGGHKRLPTFSWTTVEIKSLHASVKMPGFADVNVKLYQDICRFFSTFNAIYNLYSGTKTYSLLEHTEVF